MRVKYLCTYFRRKAFLELGKTVLGTQVNRYLSIHLCIIGNKYDRNDVFCDDERYRQILRTHTDSYDCHSAKKKYFFTRNPLRVSAYVKRILLIFRLNYSHHTIRFR